MKRLGLLGGMSWESSALYYRLINEGVRGRLGPLASADLVLSSVNFSKIEQLQRQGEWDKAGQFLNERALELQSLGVQGLALLTNTMHKVAPQITRGLKIPFLHIGDSVARALKSGGPCLLLGTRFTMEDGFLKDHITERSCATFLNLGSQDKTRIHEIIFEELCAGQILLDSQNYFYDLLSRAKVQGAHAVVLACTELQMLLDGRPCAIPILDSTTLHAKDLVDFMINL